MKGKVGGWWNKIFMEIFRRHLTVVWIAKLFVLKSFVFSFFVTVWNSLLNLWLFFMSFVATSSYIIVSRPCRLSESYLNRPSIVCQKDGSKPQQEFWWHYGCIGQKSITAKRGKLCEHQKYFWNVIEANSVWETKVQARTLISLWFCG